MGLLENKIAIITGAGRGIGKATAHQYSQEGAKVIIAEFDEQSGQETANSIGGHFFKTDISSQKSVTSFCHLLPILCFLLDERFCDKKESIFSLYC